MSRRLRRLVLAAAVASLVGASVAYAASLVVSSEKLTAVTAATNVPTTSCQLGSAADAYVDEGLPLENYGGADLYVRSELLGNKRSFLKFDIASCSIPAGAEVKSALLSLYMLSSAAESRTHEVHRLTGSFGEGTLTWLNQPSAAGAATTSTSTGTGSGTIAFNVLSDVAAFVSGTTNHGWRVKDAAEDNVSAREVTYGARENPTPAQRPVLTITYYS